MSFTKNIKRRFLSAVAFAIAACLSTVAIAQTPGQLDPTFGTQGKVTLSIDSVDDVDDVLITSAGRILVLGRSGYTTPNGFDSDMTIVSLNSNGTLQPTFGAGGVVRMDLGPYGYSEPQTIIEQPDGKILVFGESRVIGGVEGMFSVSRFTAAGQVDPTFGTNGNVHFNFMGVEESPRAMVLQPDGKIVVSGTSFDTTAAHNEFPVIARLTADGQLDTTFGFMGTGKVAMVFGTGLLDVNIGTFDVYRHNSGGYINAMHLLSDGTIAVSGSYYNGVTFQSSVFRVLTDGTLDWGFGNLSLFIFDLSPGNKNHIIGGALMPDDRIIYHCSRSGVFGDANFNIVDVQEDATYSGLSTVDVFDNYDYSEDITYPANGRPVVVGRTIFADNVSNGNLSDRFGYARLTTDGLSWSPDQYFANNGSDTLAIIGSYRCGARAVTHQSNGQIVIAGFTEIDNATSQQDLAIIRLDGSIADGIDELDQIEMSTYPNPTMDRVVVTSEAISSGSIITVHDITGSQVLQLTANQQGSISLDLSNLPSGCYVVNVVGENARPSKVVKY